jgi:hypothetical protein
MRRQQRAGVVGACVDRTRYRTRHADWRLKQPSKECAGRIRRSQTLSRSRKRPSMPTRCAANQLHAQKYFEVFSGSSRATGRTAGQEIRDASMPLGRLCGIVKL